MIATAKLNVRNSLFFAPAKYRLQFTVNYTFEDPKTIKSDKGVPIEIKDSTKYGYDGTLFSNTISHSISIRPSVMSMIVGSVLGGLIGSVTRILKVSESTSFILLDNVFAIIIAISLSAIAVVFVARKSDNQSFITVEDFWGGLLIGFLVGYTGTSFFETMTGFNENGRLGN